MIERRLAKERNAERLPRALEQTDPASGAFASLFAELHHAVRAHAQAEEAKVLLLVAELEQALDRSGMGSRYMEAKRRAPQRPHPGAPTPAPPREPGRRTARGVDRPRPGRLQVGRLGLR